MLTLKHKWLLSLVMMGGVLILGFFFPRPRDDAYYTKVVTATLLPEEARTASGVASKGTPTKPYWQFTLPRGYVSGSELKVSEFRLEALYPSMDFYRPSVKSQWLKTNPNGELGVQVDDVLWVIVSFYVQGENDAGLQAVRSHESNLGKFQVLVDPPAELAAKVPNLRMFEWKSDQDKPHDLSRDTFAYQQPDGRNVLVSGCWKSCWVDTTWHQKIRIRYVIPVARFLETAEIDLAIQHLIDSFQPTFFQ